MPPKQRDPVMDGVEMDDGADKATSLPASASGTRVSPGEWEVGGDWWHPSYRYDWLAACALALTVGLLWLLQDPRDRFFPTVCDGTLSLPVSTGGTASLDCLLLRTTEFSYPKNDSSVPAWTLLFFDFLIPLAVAAAVGRVAYGAASARAHDFHTFALALFSGFWLLLTFNAVPMKMIGQRRPNFLSNNRIDEFSSDASHSYPSGHASTSMFSLTLTACYIAGKTRWLAPDGGQVWKGLVSALFPLASIYVGASRVRDYFHDTADVNFGFSLGFSIAAVTYFAHFAPLTARNAGAPKRRGESSAPPTSSSASAEKVQQQQQQQQQDPPAADV